VLHASFFRSSPPIAPNFTLSDVLSLVEEITVLGETSSF